jgi:hypothetical protein
LCTSPELPAATDIFSVPHRVAGFLAKDFAFISIGHDLHHILTKPPPT